MCDVQEMSYYNIVYNLWLGGLNNNMSANGNPALEIGIPALEVVLEVVIPAIQVGLPAV